MNNFVCTDSPAITSSYQQQQQQQSSDSSSAMEGTSETGGGDILSPRSVREERALHYAMARFAEMEQSNNTTPATSPREKTGILTATVAADGVASKEGPFPLELLNNPIKKKNSRMSTSSTKRPLANDNDQEQQVKAKRGRKRIKSSKKKKSMTIDDIASEFLAMQLWY